MGGVPWDDLRKIFGGCQRMAKVPNAVEILPKISTAWVGCTNVTDDRQTTDGRAIAYSERERVWESKKYRVKRLIKKFPNKKWSKRGVKDFQKRLRTTGSIEPAPGSGRQCTSRTAENVDAVGDLVQSQQNQPQTHRSTRQISRELGIPETNNWRWLFLFSFAMNVNEQRIIVFLTQRVVI